MTANIKSMIGAAPESSGGKRPFFRPQSTWQVLRVVKSVDDDQHVWDPELARAWIAKAQQIAAEADSFGAAGPQSSMLYVAPKLIALWTAISSALRALNISAHALPLYRDAWMEAYGTAPSQTSTNSTSQGAIPRWVMDSLNRAGRGRPPVTIPALVGLDAGSLPYSYNLDLSLPLGDGGFSIDLGTVCDPRRYGSASSWTCTFWRLGGSDATAYHDLRGSWALARRIADALASSDAQALVNDAFRYSRENRNVPWELFVGANVAPTLAVPDGFVRGSAPVQPPTFDIPLPGAPASPTFVPNIVIPGIDSPPVEGTVPGKKTVVTVPTEETPPPGKKTVVTVPTEETPPPGKKTVVTIPTDEAPPPSKTDTSETPPVGPLPEATPPPPPGTGCVPGLVPPRFLSEAERDLYVASSPACRSIAMTRPIVPAVVAPTFLQQYWPALTIGGVTVVGALWWKWGR